MSWADIAGDLFVWAPAVLVLGVIACFPLVLKFAGRLDRRDVRK
jgi:hypothetical protein